MTTAYSRRAVLRQIGLGGIAAATVPFASVQHAFAQLDDRPWYYLTDAEARWLAAACDVFIPQDEYPSASQAGVVDFIDLQLGGDYGRGAGLYLQGPFRDGTPSQGYQLQQTPAELIRQGIAGHMGEGQVLFDLDGAARADAVQTLSERDDMLGDVPAATFFTELRSLTNEGYFADPIYLGNTQYAGWRMVGFPGAHAYYLDRVDDHNRPHRQPPMGIAHDPSGRSTLPRLISPEG